MKTELPNVIVANLHRRHTGVSSTVRDLIPHQEKKMDVGIADWGNLNRGQSKFSILSLIIKGFSKPKGIARYRVLHARRAIDMVLGIFLRDLLGQKWKIVFTSATNHHHSRMFLKLLGRMDALIATSSFTYNFLSRDRFSAEIHHGIETTRYFPDPKLSEGKNSSKGGWIGCVGRVRHAKGVDLFVDTMLKVLPEQKNYKAKIIGLCKPRDEKFKQCLIAIIERADLQGRVVFSGEVGTGGMDELYRSMVLCIACSRSEGFGLVPFEALATGTPVVTSMTGAWPILIGNDIGRVVEIDNSEEMVKTTKELLSNGELRRIMCKKAREQAVSKFHISNEARGINRIYTSLLY